MKFGVFPEKKFQDLLLFPTNFKINVENVLPFKYSYLGYEISQRVSNIVKKTRHMIHSTELKLATFKNSCFLMNTAMMVTVAPF